MMVFCQDERINHFMNLPPQLPAAEEPEQPSPAADQPILHTPEEASTTQPSPVAEQSSEEAQQPPVLHTPEEASTTQPSPAAEQSAEEAQQPPEELASEDISTQPATSSELLAEGSEPQIAASTDADGVASSENDEGEVAEDDDDYDYERLQSGLFIRKGLLIAIVSAIAVVALLAVLLVLVTRPKDPPTDWIATYTPPAGSGSTSKVLYYLHWTNLNGELKGQMQLAAIANGAPQSLTVPATGLYNRDNHIIYVVVVINGQADTLTGKISDTNDTLSLNPAGVTGTTSQFVFHTGSSDDFKQATKKLSGTK
jgi:hypothetical protein